MIIILYVLGNESAYRCLFRLVAVVSMFYDKVSNSSTKIR